MAHWFTYLKQGLSRKLPDDHIAGKQGYLGLKTNLKNLHPFVRRHWRKGLLGVVLIIFSSLLAFPQPLITRYLVDTVILGLHLEFLAIAILLLGVILLAEKLTLFLQRFYFTRYEQKVILDIQRNLLEHTLRFPKSFFDKNQTGYLMSRLLSDVQGLRWFFSSTIVYIISNLFRFLGGLVFLFYLEWRLAFGVLATLPFLLLYVHYFSKKIYILSHQSMERQATVSGRFQESLATVSLIKAFSSETRAVGRLMSELKASFHALMERSTMGSVANLVTNLTPGITRILVLALGGYWVVRGHWSLGSLLAFQVYLGYVYGPAEFLATANLQLQHARAALERVSALFDIVPEKNIGTGKKVKRLRGEIEFKNVSFSFNGSEQVLRDVSFHICPGERVAIVGPSGVGKTTLLSLILRFYNPTAGDISFDGRPASEYDLVFLRRRIGYVSQSTLLLAGTIMQNLRYGNPKASFDQVVRAAKVAGIHTFITSLPVSYETEIGENGIDISAGQKQRLALARALVKDPDILILDEPTSALDSVTEKSVFQSLPALVQGKTLFVVAHRLSAINNSDRILLLNENRLVAIGTHSNLLETNNYYRSLVTSQQISTGPGVTA